MEMDGGSAFQATLESPASPGPTSGRKTQTSQHGFICVVPTKEESLFNNRIARGCGGNVLQLLHSDSLRESES